MTENIECVCKSEDILYKQLELLAEVSKKCEPELLPDLTQAMCGIHTSIVKGY